MYTSTQVESFRKFQRIVFPVLAYGAAISLMSLALAGCNGGGHGHGDGSVIVVDGPGNSGHVRYLDTYSYDAHRVAFYQDVSGKYEPETVSVWVFPNEAAMLVSEHQLDAYSNNIAIYTRVVVFDEYSTEADMMSWLYSDLDGYDYSVQPESVTWIDNAVSVTDLFYSNAYQYGDTFVDEYEVQYYVDGVSVPGEFVLYGFSDYELVLAQTDAP